MNDINNKYLLFEVEEEYALPIKIVLEIIELGHITRVPEAPEYVVGIMNLRGNVVPVIDVRKRFCKPEPEGDQPRCVVVCNVEDNRLGLIVDNVVDLIEIAPDKLQDPPQLGSNYADVFIKNIGISSDEDDEYVKMHLIVDTDKLVNYSDLHPFDAQRQEAPKQDESK